MKTPTAFVDVFAKKIKKKYKSFFLDLRMSFSKTTTKNEAFTKQIKFHFFNRKTAIHSFQHFKKVY